MRERERERERKREREREREKLVTQVLILPITERKYFSVNGNIYMYKVNHSNSNYEKNATKKQNKKTFISIYIFPFCQ